VVFVRRIPWQLLAAAILLVLLATLATFQYRWLGEVSQAERERMRASLRTRASEFSQAFDGELTRMYMAFRVDGDGLDTDAAAALGAAYTRWQSSTATPTLVRGVYLVEGTTFDSARLRRFDPDRQVLEPVAWPAELEPLKRSQRSLPQLALFRESPAPIMLADAVDARVPALVIAVSRVTRTGNGRQVTVVTDPATPAGVVIVTIDRDRLRQLLLEPLVAKYFGEGETSEYLVTIVSRDDPTAAVFNSSSAPIDARSADVTTGLFDLRMEEFNRLADLPAGQRVQPGGRPHMAITIVRRAAGVDGKRVLMAGGDDQGAWQVRVRHRSGSLEAIVARSRRRNLAISLGVLGLLGASIVLVMGAAERQRRLARQQMEFVASVSHELRTPLAVICSAGENLADGVVADGPQVKRYGSLIETEGRRLADMVERVMEFAGISSGTVIRVKADVSVSKVIADAVRGVRGDARDRGVTVTMHTNSTLPRVTGDMDALRSAVQNIVGNAVKYSPSGAAVDVSAHVQGAPISNVKNVQGVQTVQIRVADRGLGIDAADLPHIFKPFYRGRRAVDAQVRGTGVGLSVVRRVIDAHQGTIHVDSRVGEGTTVIVELPVSSIELPASTDVTQGTDVAQPYRAAE
jgi:signal transduction histidine kinase